MVAVEAHHRDGPGQEQDHDQDHLEGRGVLRPTLQSGGKGPTAAPSLGLLKGKSLNLAQQTDHALGPKLRLANVIHWIWSQLRSCADNLILNAVFSC